MAFAILLFIIHFTPLSPWRGVGGEAGIGCEAFII